MEYNFLSYFFRSIIVFLLSTILVSGCSEEEVSSNINDDEVESGSAMSGANKIDVAEELMQDALQALNLGDTERSRAIYEKAQSAYRKKDDVLGLGHVSLGLAQLEHFTGQSDEARNNYAEAIENYRRAENNEWIAKALAAWGDLEKDTFNWDPASDLYRQARNQWELVPEPRVSDHVMLRLSSAVSLPLEEAREILDQANLIYQNLNDKAGIADVKVLNGAIQIELGNLSAAQAYYNDARFLYLDVGQHLNQAKAGEVLVKINLSRGLNVRASEMIDFTEDAFRQANSEIDWVRLKIIRGDLERIQGQLAESRAYYAEAVENLRGKGNSSEFFALIKLAEVNFLLDNITESEESLQKSLSMNDAIITTSEHSEGLLAQGILLRKLGKYELAIEVLNRALSNYDSLNSFLNIGRTNLEISMALIASGLPIDAKDYINDAEIAFNKSRLPIGSVLVHLFRGEIHQMEEDSIAATNDYRNAHDKFLQILSPLIEMNILIGQPPIDTIIEYGKNVTSDLYDELAGGVRELSPEDMAAIANNLEQYPIYLIEGRESLKLLEQRLESARIFISNRN